MNVKSRSLKRQPEIKRQNKNGSKRKKNYKTKPKINTQTNMKEKVELVQNSVQNKKKDRQTAVNRI